MQIITINGLKYNLVPVEETVREDNRIFQELSESHSKAFYRDFRKPKVSAVITGLYTVISKGKRISLSARIIWVHKDNPLEIIQAEISGKPTRFNLNKGEFSGTIETAKEIINYTAGVVTSKEQKPAENYSI